MAEIPYFFDTPIPRYFRENGWLDCENMFKFIHWSFARCQSVPHKTVKYGRELSFQPFEFMAGRLSSPKECFLTENTFRNQLLKLEKAGLLKKTTNSLTNKYSCYVWLTERFSKNNNQQNNQQSTNSQPTDNHKSRREKRISKESHPSIPSVIGDGLIDDFSSKLEKEQEGKIEVYQGVFLTQQELDDCIKIKGSLDKVKHSIEFIQTSKKRKHPITNWPNALAKWKIEVKAQVTIQDNLAYAEKLCKTFDNFQLGRGWRVQLYTDNKKDQKGILFQPESSYKTAVFIAFIDGEFQKKCYALLLENQMIRAEKQA